MENKAFFRTSFRGFKKEDVIAYIDKMSKDAARASAEKNDEMKTLADGLSAAESRICALESKIENAEKELTAKVGELSEKDLKIKDLEEKLTEALSCACEESSEKTVELEIKCEALEAENSGYKEKCNALESENAELEKKIAEYKELDSVHHELGTIIMRAEKSASDIVSRAQQESEQTVAHALKQSEEAIQRRVEACARIAQSFETGRENIDESCQIMLENLDAAKRAVDMFYASLEASSKVFKDSMSSVNNEIANFNIANKEN